MSIVKVIEVVAKGKSIEAAVESAHKEASRTLKNIQQIDIEHVHGVVEGGKVKKYRVNAKISFIVNH